MRLHGTRWEYRIGNHLVYVDNSFCFIGWAGERLVVNDETVQETSGWFRMAETFFEPWILPHGDGQLEARLRAAVMSVTCELLLDDQHQTPVAIYDHVWNGPARSWPATEDWVQREA